MTAAETREWRVVAFLDDEDDPAAMVDPVHSPELARELGFAGALVAGDNLWGWSVPAILETLGDAWLDHGWARFRFRQPVYPDDEVRIMLSPENGGAFVLRMVNPDGVDCVVGEVGLGANDALAGFDAPARMDPAPGPDPQPELRVDSALVGLDWTPMAVDASPEVLRAYMELSHRSADPPFAGEDPRLHPAWLVGRPEALMRHNFVIIGSIHTRTEVEFLAPAHAGGEVVTGGRCVAVYERRGRPYVEFDCLVRGPDGRDLARMRHTTIYDAMAGV